MVERRPTSPNPVLMALEARSALEALTLLPAAPVLLRAPRGDGHHVMVIPPFGAGDQFTTVARAYLRALGYKALAWKRHEILGLHHLVTVGRGVLEQAYEQAQSKISLVGHSLGGIYARELAREFPDYVRFVITAGSPFAGDMKANYVWPMYELATGTRIDSIPTAFLERMNEPLPVPSTAIYSRGDGVASWWCCVDEEGPQSENVGVRGSHVGLLHNPMVLYVVADRLAQPEAGWRPFELSGLRRLAYRA
jgi:pimeloyl-ACP methyl ester carboxylesterase